MTSRITLSRIIAVNWYGYRQFIDLRGLSLITGANGSGKSALLDLIQFVMLGEQLSRFNKAAAGAGSGRTLRGYCLCDTNTLGRDGQERFLRSSGVTVAALEFEFPLEEGESEPRRQTWGARIEFDSPTAKGRTLWFCIPARLERTDFLRDNPLVGGEEFLPEDEFRVHTKRDLGGESWEHQRTYLEEMKQRTALHFDREQMNKTLPKAMAFQPESNFEAFIRDYLLEAGLPDVRAVRASVDAHRRAKERLDKMRDQHTRLVRIGELHLAADKHRREAALWTHLRDALMHEESVEKLEAGQKNYRALVEENESGLRARVEAVRERDRLRERLDEVRLVVGQDSQASRLVEDKEKLAKVTRELTGLRDTRKAAAQFLHDHAQKWRDWLRLGEGRGIEAPEVVFDLLELLRSSEEMIALETVGRLSREGDRLLHEATAKLTKQEEDIRRLERREAELLRDLENYQQDHVTASPLLAALRAKGLKANALGRLIDVKPEAESWWPLLETLLASERQAILPEDFLAAWEEAQRTPSSEEPLINPAELKKPIKPHPGSVRGFFEVKHKVASAYLDQLLGNLMPVEHPSFMDEHERALSRDGWLKDPPRRVLLQPTKELTFGEEGLRRLREIRQAELHAIREELTLAKRERNDWRGWVGRAEEQRLVHPETPSVAEALRRLPEAERERGSLEETISLLSTPEREKAANELQNLVNDERGASERAVRLDERLKRVDQDIRELRDRIAQDEADERERKLERSLSRSRLIGVLDVELNDRILGARRQYSTWPKRFEAAFAMVGQEQSRATEAIRLRDDARHQFLQAHPEMADVFDPLDDDNERYDLRSRELEEQELERFQGEAERARLEWEDRLQHQVLDVLRDKLNEADRTKRELNKAMLHDVGGMQYQIVSHRDRAHSAIWTLVEKGLPVGEDMGLFNAAQQEDIERAKIELMAAIEAIDSPDDKKGQRALDYRFYHRWDIEARPVGKGEEAAISLNKSAKKQSGGENQAPFFVATLAAFHRVYDVGGRNGPATLGLVVMDEAFSKLSGDRIDDCLALARNFGLQLVMAFPEDRLPTMIEHAETVVQCRVERGYHAKTGAVNHIENWVVRVNRDRLREVLA
ncbi:SbcC/MukB-like Walker B domain-containing protein [soil metagenome]